MHAFRLHVKVPSFLDWVVYNILSRYKYGIYFQVCTAMQAYQIIKIDEATETPQYSPRIANVVSLFDISPIPNIKMRATVRERKAERPNL